MRIISITVQTIFLSLVGLVANQPEPLSFGGNTNQGQDVRVPASRCSLFPPIILAFIVLLETIIVWIAVFIIVVFIEVVWIVLHPLNRTNRNPSSRQTTLSGQTTRPNN